MKHSAHLVLCSLLLQYLPSPEGYISLRGCFSLFFLFYLFTVRWYSILIIRILPSSFFYLPIVIPSILKIISADVRWMRSGGFKRCLLLLLPSIPYLVFSFHSIRFLHFTLFSETAYFWNANRQCTMCIVHVVWENKLIGGSSFPPNWCFRFKNSY